MQTYIPPNDILNYTTPCVKAMSSKCHNCFVKLRHRSGCQRIPVMDWLHGTSCTLEVACVVPCVHAHKHFRLNGRPSSRTLLCTLNEQKSDSEKTLLHYNRDHGRPM